MKPVKLTFKAVGAVLTLMALVFALMIFMFIDSLSSQAASSCTCGDVCTMQEFKIPPTVYVGIFAVVITMLIGLILFFKGGGPFEKPSGKEAWSEKLGKLRGTERDIYRLLMDSDGAMFQSEIVEKLGMSKVKATRTLDKLESLQLIERKRRGPTNIVVLK
ncbi:MAG: MarR family transcriptional regulator [Candidatus Altiarchaeota archaeon]